VVAFDEFDGLGLGAALEDLGGALERQILDQHDDVAIGEDIAVGIADNAGANGSIGFRGPFPFMAAGHAFPEGRMLHDLSHLALGTGGTIHRGFDPAVREDRTQ